MGNVTVKSPVKTRLPNNGVVFGSGNANGGFTVDTQNGVEIGLRAKVRFDENNSPQNQFNSNGDGTYTFDATAPFGFSWMSTPFSPSTAAWNFEWSVDVTQTPLLLNAFTYLFEIDYDPIVGTNFLAFDPINTPGADNYGGLSVNQNSWNMEFFNGPGFEYLNTANGQFEIRLSAFDGQTLLASSNITVFQNATEVSAPGAAAFMLLGGLGLLVSRKRKN